jgi:cytochrome c553
VNKERRIMGNDQPSKGKRTFYFGLAAAAILLHACTSRMAEAAPAPTPAESVRVVKGDPPPTSQLALLMRDMTAFADSTGKLVSAGKELPVYPVRFKAIMTAEATPGMVEHRTFDPYAQAWLGQLDALYAAPASERNEVFNSLVQTCAACHGQMCPGPLVRIKKLTIQENED